jgi:uncharacterized protein YdgA (DUF945 family)
MLADSMKDAASHFNDFQQAMVVLEWARDNGMLNTAAPLEELAEQYAIQYSPDHVKSLFAQLKIESAEREARQKKPGRSRK